MTMQGGRKRLLWIAAVVVAAGSVFAIYLHVSRVSNYAPRPLHRRKSRAGSSAVLWQQTMRDLPLGKRCWRTYRPGTLWDKTHKTGHGLADLHPLEPWTWDVAGHTSKQSGLSRA